MTQEVTDPEAESTLTLEEEREVEDFCRCEEIPILKDPEGDPMVWQTEIGLGDLKVVISIHPSEGEHIQPVLDGYKHDFWVFTTGEHERQIRNYRNRRGHLHSLSLYDPEISWAVKVWLVVEGYGNPVEKLNESKDVIDITALELPYSFWIEVQKEVIQIWGVIEEEEDPVLVGNPEEEEQWERRREWEEDKND